MSRPVLVAGSLVLAAIAAGALVVIFSLRSGAASPSTALLGESRVASMLRDVEQRGVELGSRTAPVTLIEFADPQCPYCGMWERDALPEIVARYVRPGKVRLIFQGMTFLGADSGTALRTAIAAGNQDRFWNVIALLFENQGAENTGWVTDSLVRTIGGAVPGLDTARMLDDRASAAVENAVAGASSVAARLGVHSTPTFAVGSRGGQFRLVDATGLVAALDAALAR